MILRFATKVFKDAVFPVLFHQGPVLHLSVTNRHGYLIYFRVLVSLISNEEIQVGDVFISGSTRLACVGKKRIKMRRL